MKKSVVLFSSLLIVMSATSVPAMDIYTDNIAENFVFTIDGVDVALPFPVSNLTDQGWELSQDSTFGEGDVNRVLSSYTYDYISLHKDDTSMSVTVLNPTVTDKLIPDCYVSGIGVFKTDGTELTLKNGLDFNSTFNDVLDAYGLDQQTVISEYAEGSEGFEVSFYLPEDNDIHTDVAIDYNVVGRNQIKFQFDKPLTENGTLEYIQLIYMNTVDETEESDGSDGTSADDALWICPECGVENDGNFCIECGEKKPEDVLNYCPECGYDIPEGSKAKFCPNCGAKLNVE